MIAAIAGRAWRTPLGASIERAVSRWLAGEHAVQPAPHAAPAACRLRCAIPDPPRTSRNERFLDRLGLLALDAGREAMAGARFAAGDPRLELTALFTATGGLRPPARPGRAGVPLKVRSRGQPRREQGCWGGPWCGPGRERASGSCPARPAWTPPRVSPESRARTGLPRWLRWSLEASMSSTERP